MEWYFLRYIVTLCGYFMHRCDGIELYSYCLQSWLSVTFPGTLRAIARYSSRVLHDWTKQEIWHTNWSDKYKYIQRNFVVNVSKQIQCVRIFHINHQYIYYQILTGLLRFRWDSLQSLHRPLGDGLQRIAQTHHRRVVVVVALVQHHGLRSRLNWGYAHWCVALLNDSPVECASCKTHNYAVSHYVGLGFALLVQVQQLNIGPRDQRQRCILDQLRIGLQQYWGNLRCLRLHSQRYLSKIKWETQMIL